MKPSPFGELTRQRCVRFLRANGIDPFEVSVNDVQVSDEQICYDRIERGPDGSARLDIHDGVGRVVLTRVCAPVSVRWEDVP